MGVNTELRGLKTDTALENQALYRQVVSKTPISNCFLEDLQPIIDILGQQC